MAMSIVGDSPAPPDTSGVLSDEAHSTRQPLANTIAASEVPVTSFRALLPADRATISSQQRRGGNLVLFVKPTESESEVASRGAAAVASQAQQQSHGGSATGDKDGSSTGGDEDAEKGQDDLFSMVVSTSANTLGSVRSVATGAARKPLVTAALVLLYIILLDIVLLDGNERLNRVLCRMRAAEDEALILLSASLARQMAEAKEELRVSTSSHSGGTLADAYHKAVALERVCNRSVTRLHKKLMFPGSVDDLVFLIEEHATFDRRLRDVAAHELEWAAAVLERRAVQTGPASEETSWPSASSVPGPSPRAVEEKKVAQDAETAANPLRHVRLQRVSEEHVVSTVVDDSAAPRRRVRAENVAPSRRRAGGGDPLGSEATEAERATRGVLRLLKNKYVAFLLMCVLVSAVLRMG